MKLSIYMYRWYVNLIIEIMSIVEIHGQFFKVYP